MHRFSPSPIKAGSSYQLRKPKDGVESKVRVCRYGYSQEFKDEDDVKPIKILAFCKAEKFMKVTGSNPTGPLLRLDRGKINHEHQHQPIPKHCPDKPLRVFP